MEEDNTGIVHPHWEVKVLRRNQKPTLQCSGLIRKVASKATSETTVLLGNVEMAQNEST